MRKHSSTPASMYGLLICGLILTICGLWMYATNQEAAGYVRGGRGAGSMFGHMNGLYIAVVGAVMTGIPLYSIFVRKKKHRNNDAEQPGN